MRRESVDGSAHGLPRRVGSSRESVVNSSYSSWPERLASAVPPGDQYVFASAVIDPHSHGVVGHNRHFGSVFARNRRALDNGIDTLLESGCVARDDLDDLLEQASERPRKCATVSSTATVDLGSGPETAERHVSWVPSPSTNEPAICVMVHTHALTREAPSGPPRSRRAAINYLYDGELNVIAADPYMDGYLLDPMRHIGVSSLLLCHPDDLVAGQRAMWSVARGERRSVDYIVRGAGPHGVWSPVHIELRSLVGAPGTAHNATMLATVEPIAPNRTPLPLGDLTARELDIVYALYRGLRVPQVCDRFGVSEKTVRNQLSVLFRKLGVASQSELLEKFARPTRTVAQLSPDS